MKFPIPICVIVAGMLWALPAAAAEVQGEWSLSPDQCDEMRVVYAADGSNPTVVNADGDWVEVSEPTTWERDGDILVVSTEARTDTWEITNLTGDRLEMVNQSETAAEHGAGEASFHRCPPRD